MTSSTFHSARRRCITPIVALLLTLLAPLLAASPAQAAGPECQGSPTRVIRYAATSNTVYLEGCNQLFTPSDVLARYRDGSKTQLVDAANKIWYLKANIMVTEGAVLSIKGRYLGGDTDWLRMKSDGSGFVWIKTQNGHLSFRDTKVTSWDQGKGTVDANYQTAGRAYITARSVWTSGRSTVAPTACGVNDGSREFYEARMDVINSEMAYLGYNAAESYGLVWKVYSKTPPPDRKLYATVDVFGNMTDSRIHHNYFGTYMYGSYCQDFARNIFEKNIQYGLDPHDDSDYLTAQSNLFRDNGNHGFICSVQCNDLRVIENTSVRNRHGIMLHRNVNGALVHGNVVQDNREAGIAVFDSHDNLIRRNIVQRNLQAAARLSVGASRNRWEQNHLEGPSADSAGSGYAVYMFQGSDAPTTGDGIPSDNVFYHNTIIGYKDPVIRLSAHRNTQFIGNKVSGPGTAQYTDGPGANRSLLPQVRFLRPSDVGPRDRD